MGAPPVLPPPSGAHRGLVKTPETLVQVEPSPPHTMHLSNFFLEPMTRSQPVGTQRPRTHTPVPSGEQGVPSATCGTQTTASAPRGATPTGKGTQDGDAHPRFQHVVVAQAARLAGQLAPILLGDPAVARHPVPCRRQPLGDVGAMVVGGALLLPKSQGCGVGGHRAPSAPALPPKPSRCAPIAAPTHGCSRDRPRCCRSGTGCVPPGSSGRRCGARGGCRSAGRS